MVSDDAPRTKAMELAREIQEHARLMPESVAHPKGLFDVDAFASVGLSNELDLDKVGVDVTLFSRDEIKFDLRGTDAPIANAIRRIVLSEVKTVAIDKVNVYQNTSALPDEVLVHRIGLVPLNIHPSMLQDNLNGEDTEFNTVVFALHVICPNKGDINHPESATISDKVMASDLRWIPQGSQTDVFAKLPPKSLFPDIPICKLAPGQEIEMSLFCTRGDGKMHAKWSPVSTAVYRLKPDVRIKGQIKGKDAKALKNVCPVGVFDVEDLQGDMVAVVANQDKCTSCRECVRDKKFQDKVELRKCRSHFQFHIESVGMLGSEELVPEALSILSHKCETLLQCLDAIQ